MNLLLLYIEFVKIGAFAVGGGLATLPFLFEIASRGEWLSPEMIGNYLAIAQSAPGPVGVNLAAQAGFQYAGVTGSALAVLGLISPAILIVIFVARILQSFRENKTVAAVFTGLRPAAAGLLAAAGFGVWKLTLYAPAAVWYRALRWKECALFILIFAGILRFKKHPLCYVVIAGLAGILLKL